MGLDRELAGRLVVSIEQAVAAPYCGLMLADAGARVIKVERPEGDFARGYDKGADGESVFFAWLNRGKQAVCLDLNRSEDAALLHRMLGRADVFLHNLAPGALDRRGFGGQALRAQNPGLITCEITGYGRTGAAAEMKAYDFLVQAESGLCATTGFPGHPARIGVSICDIATGLTCFSAILRALIRRERTGVGLDLSISMFDVVADWMNFPLLAERYLGGAPVPEGLTHAFIAPSGAYSTRDGSKVMITIQNPREWSVFCRDILSRPDLGDDPRFATNADRMANRPAMDAEINAVFGQRDREELIQALSAARIAWARLNDVADLSQHPFLRTVTARYGGTGTAVTYADLPVRTMGDRPAEVPALDQHGVALRQEFGG